MIFMSYYNGRTSLRRRGNRSRTALTQQKQIKGKNVNHKLHKSDQARTCLQVTLTGQFNTVSSLSKQNLELMVPKSMR